jgi:hypothetical protein
MSEDNGMETDSYESRVIAMLNTRLSDGVKDFGTIVDYVVIIHNCSKRYVFLTDSGRRIDSGSAMRFMNAYRRKLASAPKKVFPDGTDKALRIRQSRINRKGSRSIGATISNVANVGDERIDISSTVTSAGAFPEEYTDGKGK